MDKGLLKIRQIDKEIKKLEKERYNLKEELNNKYNENKYLKNKISELQKRIEQLKVIKTNFSNIVIDLKNLKLKGLGKMLFLTFLLILFSTTYMIFVTDDIIGMLVGAAVGTIAGLPIGISYGYNDYFKLKKTYKKINIKNINKEISKNTKKLVLDENKYYTNKAQIEDMEVIMSTLEIQIQELTEQKEKVEITRKKVIRKYIDETEVYCSGNKIKNEKQKKLGIKR